MPRPFRLPPLLAALGRRSFGWRLPIGLAIAAAGLELLTPTPFFAEGYRLIHGCALLLILGGLAVRAWGSAFAGEHTRSARIEAPRLITAGPFAYVRNPIYVGTIALGFGMAALIGDPWAFVLTVLAFTILYFLIVPAEEEFLSRQFGEEYARYRACVPRLIPRLRPWSGRAKGERHWRAMRGEIFIALWLVGIYVALLVEEHFDQVSP